MPVFEALGDRLTAALKKITGRGVLRPEEVESALREVRLALLEADVNFNVVKEFVDHVRARLVGVEVSPGLTAPQQVVKAVNAELVELLGGNSEGLRYAPAPPTAIMLVGLQGSGKTTTAVKLALLARRDGHKPAVVALDLRRPAAVEQLRTLADREGVAFHGGQGKVEDIAVGALKEAARLGHDVVILDTAGRLHVDSELMDELVRLKAAVKVTETLAEALRYRCAWRPASRSVSPAPVRSLRTWRSSTPSAWRLGSLAWATSSAWSSVRSDPSTRRPRRRWRVISARAT